MNVSLSRFRVKPGQSARVDEWLAMLNARMDENLQALEREKMKLEVIFREVIDGAEYLYWFSVQDETGAPVETSPFDVDRQHLAFTEECIDFGYGMREAQPQAVFVPPTIAQAMQWADPPSAAVAFERRELIHRRG